MRGVCRPRVPPPFQSAGNPLMSAAMSRVSAGRRSAPCRPHEYGQPQPSDAARPRASCVTQPPHDSAYTRLRYAVRGSQGILRTRARGVVLAKLLSLAISQAGAGILFTEQPSSEGSVQPASTHVFRTRYWFQVLRIHACAVPAEVV